MKQTQVDSTSACSRLIIQARSAGTRWIVDPAPRLRALPRSRSRSPPREGLAVAEHEPGYSVTFLTARGCFAGTRAQVVIILVGEPDSTCGAPDILS